MLSRSERGGATRRDDVHLVFDFGQVISRGQPAGTMRELAELADVEESRFSDRYWQYREAYDLGMDARDYWSAVTGASALTQETVDHLTSLDVERWTRLDEGTIEVIRDLRSRGIPLTLLSNAPHAQADAVERIEQMRELFPDMVFSARLGVVKPHPEIYAWTARRVTLTARIVLVDDRVENLDAARQSGWGAIHFRSAAQLRRDIGATISKPALSVE